MRIKKPKVPKYLKSVRYVLGVTNILFLITGLLLIATGVSVFAIFSQYELFVTNRFYSLSEFIIATGAIILITSILGFYGAYSEKFFFIAGYVVFCLVVLVFNVSIAVAGSRLRDDVTSELRGTMVPSLNLYGDRSDHTKAWDDLQTDFECCGVSSRNDWISSAIPVSCCHIDYGTVSPFECKLGNAYTTGCLAELSGWLGGDVEVITVVGLVVIGLQVLITAVAAWMAWRAKFEEVELES